MNDSPKPLQGLADWLRAQAQRHVLSPAYKDPHVAEHIGTLLTWAREVQACAALSEAPAKWLPIETAPKDGTRVLLYHPGYKNPFYPRDSEARWWVDRWQSGFWYQTALDAPPTRWMPLLASPGAAAVQQAAPDAKSEVPPNIESEFFLGLARQLYEPDSELIGKLAVIESSGSINGAPTLGMSGAVAVCHALAEIFESTAESIEQAAPDAAPTGQTSDAAMTQPNQSADATKPVANDVEAMPKLPEHAASIHEGGYWLHLCGNSNLVLTIPGGEFCAHCGLDEHCAAAFTKD